MSRHRKQLSKDEIAWLGEAMVKAAVKSKQEILAHTDTEYGKIAKYIHGLYYIVAHPLNIGVLTIEQCERQAVDKYIAELN